MGSKAMGEKRRRLRKAPLIAASLAMVLAAVVPALAQESTSATGVLVKTGAASYAITDEASGTSYSLTSQGVNLDAYVGQKVTVHGTQSGPSLLNVTGIDAPTPSQQPGPDPVQPPGSSSEGTQDTAHQAAQVAQEAAQEAREASDATQLSVQQAAPASVQGAQEAAQEAQQASDAAQAAAQVAQQAASSGDIRSAQNAAQEARQASGAAQAAQQAAQQAVTQAAGTDVKDAYTRAVQAARSVGDEGNNIAFAAEGEPQGAGANPEKAASGGGITGEGAAGKDKVREGNTRKDVAGEDEGRKGGAHKDAVGKDVTTGEDKGAASEGSTGNDEETTREEATRGGAGKTGSNAAAITTPVSGSVSLLLGGSALLTAGIFVARKIF